MPSLSCLLNGMPGWQKPLSDATTCYQPTLRQHQEILAAVSAARGNVNEQQHIAMLAAAARNFHYASGLTSMPSMNTPGVLQYEHDRNSGLLPIASFLTGSDEKARALIHAVAAQGYMFPAQAGVFPGNPACNFVPTNTMSNHGPGPTHCDEQSAEAKEGSTSSKAHMRKDDECLSDDSSSTTATRPISSTQVPSREPRKSAGRRSQWSAEEHQRFLAGLARFGPKDKDASTGEPGARVSVGLGPGVAEVIAVVVGTRTVSQVRSHAQKYFLRQTRKSVCSNA